MPGFSDRGMTASEYSSMVSEVTSWATGSLSALVDGLHDASKTIAQKWELSAEYHAELMHRMQRELAPLFDTAR